jgi:hypothetical protein
MELADAVFALQDDLKALQAKYDTQAKQVTALQGQLNTLQATKTVVPPQPPVFDEKAVTMRILGQVNTYLQRIEQPKPPVAKTPLAVVLLFPVLLISMGLNLWTVLSDDKNDSTPVKQTAQQEVAPDPKPTQSQKRPRAKQKRKYNTSQPQPNPTTSDGLSPKEQELLKELENWKKNQH